MSRHFGKLIRRRKLSLKDRLEFKNNGESVQATEEEIVDIKENDEIKDEVIHEQKSSEEMSQIDKVSALFNLDEFDDDLDAQQLAKKAFEKEREKFVNKELIKPYEEDIYDQKLVQRPQRETVWGLGGQLLKRNESKNSFSSMKLSMNVHLSNVTRVFQG